MSFKKDLKILLECNVERLKGGKYEREVRRYGI